MIGYLKHVLMNNTVSATIIHPEILIHKIKSHGDVEVGKVVVKVVVVRYLVPQLATALRVALPSPRNRPVDFRSQIQESIRSCYVFISGTTDRILIIYGSNEAEFCIL